MVAKPLERWFPHRRLVSGASLRLVCFPFAGGGASTYRSWANELPRSIEVWAVEPPGRETRFSEPPAEDVDSIVTPVVEHALASDQRPIALFGHSLGALLAFEAARRLRAHDRLPIWLFASGARAPDVPRRNAPMADLPDHDFVKKLGEYQGTPREVLDNRELMELLIPLLRADFRLAEQYAYLSEPALDCPIAAIGGTADVDVTNDDLDAWRTHTGRTFTRHRVPGNHFFVSTARADVLRLVAERLAR